MDFVSLKKHAILIPTPGQTEQEYLAKFMMEKNLFYSVSQNDFNLDEAVRNFKNYKLRL
jgi:UDP-N-acetylglucosamine:LPS N-acetylglucosamine transferase